MQVFLGPWTKALQDVIKTCLRNQSSTASPSSSATLQSPSADDISNYAVTLYGTLSKQTHGAPWDDTNAVHISDQLESLDRCVVIELCKKMGIM